MQNVPSEIIHKMERAQPVYYYCGKTNEGSRKEVSLVNNAYPLHSATPSNAKNKYRAASCLKILQVQNTKLHPPLLYQTGRKTIRERGEGLHPSTALSDWEKNKRVNEGGGTS